jgi:hypothetical protein
MQIGLDIEALPVWQVNAHANEWKCSIKGICAQVQFLPHASSKNYHGFSFSFLFTL